MADHNRELAAYVDGIYDGYVAAHAFDSPSVEGVSSLGRRELRHQSVPSSTDETLRTRLKSTERNYEELGRQLTERGLTVLRVFAERAASWSVQQGEIEILYAGLFAACLVLDGSSSDPRETYLFLPCYRRAFERIGLDPAVAAQGAIPVEASPQTRRTILGYMKPTGASLEDMGYREIEPDERGLAFVRLAYDESVVQTRRLAKEKLARLLEERKNQGQ